MGKIGGSMMKFIELINDAIIVIGKEKSINEKQNFADRYTKMIEYLEKLKVAYQLEKMNRKSICLNIVRMLDHGDSEILQEAVTKVNHYYQENIYEE